MKLRSWFVIGWSVSVGAGVAIACGGSSDDPKPATVLDSGSDVAANADTGGPKDSGKDVTPDTGCDLSKSFLEEIPADAAIDDAGRNTGICKACMKAKCNAEVAACDTDCDCKGVIVDIVECVQTGKPLITCAQTAGGDIPQTTLINIVAPLGLCIQNKCKDECIPASLQDASFDARLD